MNASAFPCSPRPCSPHQCSALQFSARRFCVAILLGATLVACNPDKPAKPPKALPPETLTALQVRYNENDAQGAAAQFTDDGVIMTAFGESVIGRPAIEAFFRAELDKRMQYWVTSEGSGTAGKIGYDFGRMRIRDTVKGMDLEKAKYMTLYRNEGNSWKIQRMIYNTNSLNGCPSVQIVPTDVSAETQKQ